jgi:hypothetical protein
MNKAQISQFIWTLKQGETCKFSDAFLTYQKQNEESNEM